LTRVPVTLESISASLEGRAPHEQISTSLKGPAPLEQVSASLEAQPRPMTPSLSPPIGALNALTHRGRHGQKANPPHAAPLTPLGNQAPALCGQTVTMQPSPALALHADCADMPVSFQNTMLPAPVLPRRAPRKGTGATSKGVLAATKHMTRATPWRGMRGAQPIHLLRRCAAIPDDVAPYADGMSPHRCLCIQGPSLNKTLERAWAHPRTSIRTTTTHGRKSRAPSKPFPDKYRSCHVGRGSRDSSSSHPGDENTQGQLSRQEHCTPVHRHCI
jgi:hypothetical protein